MDSRVNIPHLRLAPNPVLSNLLALESIAGAGALLGDNMNYRNLTVAERFLTKIKYTDTCWLWTDGKNPQGYGNFSMKHKTIGAHRLIYLLYYGELPPGLCVLHKCDTPACVRPDHLFLGTHADNHNDMVNKGRARHIEGEKHYKSKLTNNDIVAIRKLKGKMRIEEIGEIYGVCRATIGYIHKGDTWKHVK